MSSEPVNPENSAVGSSSSTAAAPALVPEAEATQAAPAAEPVNGGDLQHLTEGAAVSAPEELGSAEKPADTSAVPAVSAAESSEAPPPETPAGAEVEGSLPSNEELNQFMDQYSPPQQAPTEGEIVEGRVIAVNDLGVVVDIGGKTEGLIPSQEFVEASDHTKLLPGQTIEVQLTGEHKEGYAVLSYQRARRRRVWSELDKAYREKTNVTGQVVDRVKGGLVVDVGVRAFLPASQLDLRPMHELDEWKGRELEVRVLKLNRKRGNVVVSRRAILEGEQQAQRQKLIDSLAEGQVFHGTVKSITSYGVFVDLGGIDGLLHVSDLSWGRVANPADVVRPGEEIDVQVLKFDREKNRISLGRRQLLPDPWATVPERFPVGTRVQGKVVGTADYGAFVELDSGVEGLVHVSELSWSKRKQHPSKLVQVGDAVEVVVLELKPEQRRISLGLKQAQPDPWVELSQKYPVGSKVSGKVRMQSLAPGGGNASGGGQTGGRQAPAGNAGPPIDTMSDLMTSLVYPPTNNILLSIYRGGPQNDADWATIQRNAVLLAESGNVLLMRAPAGANQADWARDAKALVDAGAAVYKAARAKDSATLLTTDQAINASCVTCHKQFRFNNNSAPIAAPPHP